MLNKKTERLSLAFPTKIYLPPVDTRRWNQYASERVWACQRSATLRRRAPRSETTTAKGRGVNAVRTVTRTQTASRRLRSSSFFWGRSAACSHQRGVRRQRSIQPVLSARAFPRWHLCNFKLGLSGEGGTKLLFVLNRPSPSC